MNNSTPNITPLELATLAARFSDLLPEEAIERAEALYKAACAKLAPATLDSYKELKNRADSLREFLGLLQPEETSEYLRDKVIEWRFKIFSENKSKKANGKLYTLKDTKEQIALWEQGIGWKSVTDWGDFKKFVLEAKEAEKRLKEKTAAAQREQTRKSRQENAANTNKKKRNSFWLEIAKKGGDQKNRRHQEFIKTIQIHGSNAGGALNSMGIYLTQETIEQCVPAVKKLDKK